jgi:predicted nucleotidyltransferase
MTPQIAVDRARLAEFCRRHHIRRLSFFGSVLGDSFRPDSDVDVLVEFEPNHVPGLLTLAGLEIELSGLLGRKADVRTVEDLSRYFRDEVVAKAQLLYAAA